MVNKYLKHAFFWVMSLLVYALLGPVVSIYYWLLRCRLATQTRRLRVKGENEKSQSSIGKYKSSQMVELTKLSNAEKHDFKKHRSLTYIHQVTFGSLNEFSKLASGRQNVPLVPNHVLLHVLFNSVFSYGLVKEDNALSNVAWRFSFEDMGDYKLFRGFYWDVAEIMILKSGRLNIRDRSGKIHTPRCKTWPLAKAHVQTQLTFFVPGLAHNHVHFVLPSVIACEVRKKLPETSVLRQLLEPHSRFTQYINYQALNESLSSSNNRTLADRFLRPWLSMPMRNEDFIAGIQKKCEKYYNENFSVIPKLNDDIAYQSFLKAYYGIFRNFVADLSPLLKSDYEILRTAMVERVPGVARESMTDVLGGFLWNSCVVHYCDHESYLRQWARRYGCMAIRVPLVKPEPEKTKIPINTISGGKINDAFSPESKSADKRNYNDQSNTDVIIETYHYSAEDGSRFFRSTDICRTRCFLRTFVQYNECPKVNMKLFDTKYAFSDPMATSAAAHFLTDLRDLSSILKQRGEAIVKAEDFIRSVCY